MKKDQEDTLNMYQTVDGVLQSHIAVWTANTPFSDVVDDLEDNIDGISNLADQQETDITGIAADKENKRNVLEEQTYTVGSIITFYASTTNNRNLKEKADYTRTELHDARDNEVPSMSRNVHEAAVDNAAALVAYGLTAGMITDLQTAINDFFDIISKPREALAETSAATEELPPLFAATTKLLEEQLDKGMELYRVSNVDFYTQYFNARIIVNSPTLTRALEVKFTTEKDSEPSEHVKVTIDDNITRRSSEFGNIRVQSLDEGTHHLKATLPGCVTVELDFNIISGETTKLAIKMIKKPNPN